jgi:hypothetical protein
VTTPATIPEDKMQTIRIAVAAGATVDAIKLYREATGCDLPEATKAIEEIQNQVANPTTSRSQYFWFGLFSLFLGGALLCLAIAMPTKKSPTFPGVILGGMFALCGLWMLAAAFSKSGSPPKQAPAWVAALLTAGLSTMAFWVAIFDPKGIRGGIPFLPDTWNQSLGRIAFCASGIFCLVLTIWIIRSAFRRK